MRRIHQAILLVLLAWIVGAIDWTPARADVELSFGSAGSVTSPFPNHNFDWNETITIKAEGVKVYFDWLNNHTQHYITWDMAVEDDGNMLGRDQETTYQDPTTNGSGHWEHKAHGDGICQGTHAARSSAPPAQETHTANPYAEIYQVHVSKSQTITPVVTYYVNTTP